MIRERTGLRRGRAALPIFALLTMGSVAHVIAGPPTTAPADVYHVTGKVFTAAGDPAAGAAVTFHRESRPITVIATTNGTFDFALPEQDRVACDLVAVTSVGADPTQLGYAEYCDRDEPGLLAVALKPARQVDVTVTDTRRQPAAGVWVVTSAWLGNGPTWETTTDAAGRAIFKVPADLRLNDVIAEKDGVGFDYAPLKQFGTGAAPLSVNLKMGGTRSVTLTALDPAGHAVPGVRFMPSGYSRPNCDGRVNLGYFEDHFARTSGADGTVVVSSVPIDALGTIDFFGQRDGYCLVTAALWPPHDPAKCCPALMVPLSAVSGSVVGPDGRPASGGCVIRYFGLTYSQVMAHFRGEPTTNRDGRFKVDVDPGGEYIFAAADEAHHLASAPLLVQVDGRAATPAVALSLRPATRVHGRLLMPDGRPVSGVSVHLRETASTALRPPTDDDFADATHFGERLPPCVYQSVKTDDSGGYSFESGPAWYAVEGRPDQGWTPRTLLNVESQREVVCDLMVRQQEQQTPARYLPGRVVPADHLDSGVAGVFIGSWSRAGGQVLTCRSDAEGRFTARSWPAETYLYAVTDDGRSAAIAAVAETADAATVPLAPAATATGRLLDGSGRPVAGKAVECVWGQYQWCPPEVTRRATTGADGRFKIDGLVPGHSFKVWVVTPGTTLAAPVNCQPIGRVAPTTSGPTDMGDRRLDTPATRP